MVDDVVLPVVDPVVDDVVVPVVDPVVDDVVVPVVDPVVDEVVVPVVDDVVVDPVVDDVVARWSTGCRRSGGRRRGRPVTVPIGDGAGRRPVAEATVPPVVDPVVEDRSGGEPVVDHASLIRSRSGGDGAPNRGADHASIAAEPVAPVTPPSVGRYRRQRLSRRSLDNGCPDGPVDDGCPGGPYYDGRARRIFRH